MKILYLASRLHPDQTSCGLLANKLLIALSKKYEVDVITGDEEYISYVSQTNQLPFSIKIKYSKSLLTYVYAILMNLSSSNNLIAKILHKLFAVSSYLVGLNFFTIMQIYFWKKKLILQVATVPMILFFVMGRV